MHDMAARDRNPSSSQERVLMVRNLPMKEKLLQLGMTVTSLNSHSASIPDMKWDGSVMVTWSR